MDLQDCTGRPLREVVRVHRARKKSSNKGVEGMHRGGRGRALTAATILALVVTSACSGSSEPTTTPTPTVATSASPSPTPSQSPSPTSASASEIAARDAEAVLREYYQVIDELRADPNADPSILDDVAVSVALVSRQRQVERERGDGWHQSGETRIVELENKGVNLDNTDGGGTTVPVVQFDVCIDVGDVDIVDANGSSVVADERPTRGWERHTVANYDWESDPAGGWRVSTSQTLEQQPCDSAN